MGALGRQTGRFIGVGLAASATHIAVAALLVEGMAMRALFANLIAFSLAAPVSYFGNRLWTFRSQGARARELPRFLVSLLLGVQLNQAITYTLVDLLRLDYRLALLAVVAVVPATVFAIQRRWVFQPQAARSGA